MAKTQRLQDIGDRLRLVIERTHGIARGAQAQWARDHARKPQNVNNWLQGLSHPDVELMIELCEKYGFTLDWIYRGVQGGVSVSWAEYLREKRLALQGASPELGRRAREKVSS